MKKRFTLITAALALLLLVCIPKGMYGQTDVIDNSATSSYLGNTSTTSWATNFTITGASGAQYYIHSMGTKNTDNALQWNSNGFLYMTTTATDKKLKSITIVTTANKNISLFAQNTAYTASPTGSTLATIAATSSGTTYNFTGNYTYLALKGTASSTSIASITIEWEDPSSSVSTPSFDPVAGTYYTNKSVTISCATEGASIYYTTDGTTPTNSSTLYEGPVSIEETTTLKAIAIKEATSSTVATATYTLKVATPTFSPVAGTYDVSQNVTISSTAGARIYYTVDGTTPTTSSTLYEGAISVSATTTIKAIAIKDNWSNSSVATAEYSIVSISPAELPFVWAGGSSSDLLATTGVTAYGLGSDYSAGTHSPYLVKFDNTGDYIQVKTDSQPAKVTVGVKKIGGANSSKITVKASTDGITFDEGEELTIDGAANAIVNLETTRSFGSTVRYVRLVFTKEANVGVGPIGITKYTTNPIINAPDVVNLSSTDTNNEFDYSITNPTEGSLVASSSDGWISNINTTLSKVTFETTENTSITENRTGHITLTYPGADNKIVEIVQSKVDYAALPIVFTGGKDDFPVGFSQSGLGSDYDSSPYLKFDGTGDILILKINESATQLHFDIKGNNFSGGTFTFQWSADGLTYNALATYTTLNSPAETKSFDLSTLTTARYFKWVYTEKSNGNVALGNIRVSANANDYFVDTELDNLSGVTTVYSPATLTFTGTNANPANLIIKDGGQLVHTNDVTATLEKEIAGYGGAKGGSHWYTIASPVDNEPVSTLTTGTYDLYAYTESTHTWYNQKAHTGDFTTLSRGTGYLYANSAAKVIDFAGSMKATNAEVTVNLSYTDALPVLKGVNLVGNPFTRNLTAGEVKIDGTALTTYLAVEVGSELAVRNISSNPIKPGQGFFVQLPESHTTTNLVFNPSSKGETVIKPAFVCIEAGDANFMDRAYVQIGQGNMLNKVTINEEVSHLYVTNKGKDFAAVTIENAQGEMPVNFKAAYDGNYSISVSTVGLDLNYLHLIDKLTGNDIDLLATPEYTFSAKRGDGENRFRLVFEANGNALVTSNEPFAYFNGSEWVIENDGNATLQVIDVMGRMLRSENVSGNATTSLPNLSAGVYVLRLVNSESIRTQKVVIE